VSWLGTNRDGRLEAFVVLDNDVLDWYENTPGGRSFGPDLLRSGPIAQRVSVTSTHDGRLQVFGLRLDTHDIVTAFQTPPLGAFSGWENLGNPNGSGHPFTGLPVAARNADGRLEAWCRNSNGGMSTRFQTSLDGPWGNWQDLGGGPDLSDEAPAVILDSQNRVQLFGASRSGVVRWFQHHPNSSMPLDANWSTQPPAAQPTAVRMLDGRAVVVVRKAVDGHALIAVESSNLGVGS